MKTQEMIILNNEEMLQKMLGAIESVSKDFPRIKEEYEQSIFMLRRELGDEKVDKFLNAINRRCEADMLFCGSLGYHAKIACIDCSKERAVNTYRGSSNLTSSVLVKLWSKFSAKSEIVQNIEKMTVFKGFKP